MKAKEIRKLVVERIYQGMRKQDIFEELNASLEGREIELTIIIANQPSLAQRQKWQLLNVSVMVMLCVSILCRMAFVVSQMEKMEPIVVLLGLMMPLLSVLIMWRVANYYPRSYKSVGLIGIIGAVHLTNSFGEGLNQWWMIVDLSMMAGLIVLGFFLHHKLKGRYSILPQTHADASSGIGGRSMVHFEE